jgi:hypothetical protein
MMHRRVQRYNNYSEKHTEMHNIFQINKEKNANIKQRLRKGDRIPCVLQW